MLSIDCFLEIVLVVALASADEVAAPVSFGATFFGPSPLPSSFGFVSSVASCFSPSSSCFPSPGSGAGTGTFVSAAGAGGSGVVEPEVTDSCC